MHMTCSRLHSASGGLGTWHRCIRERGRRSCATSKLARGPDSERIRAFVIHPSTYRQRLAAQSTRSMDRASRPLPTRTLFNKSTRGAPETGRIRRLALCGCGAVASARPCHGRGHGFKPRHPLHDHSRVCPCTSTRPAWCACVPVRPRRRAAEVRLARLSRADTAEIDLARVAQVEEQGPCKTQVAGS